MFFLDIGMLKINSYFFLHLSQLCCFSASHFIQKLVFVHKLSVSFIATLLTVISFEIFAFKILSLWFLGFTVGYYFSFIILKVNSNSFIFDRCSENSLSH